MVLLIQQIYPNTQHIIVGHDDGRQVIHDVRDLLPNPDEAVVVVAAEPKPNAVDAVVLAPNEPKENPEVSSKEKQTQKS